MKFTAEQQSKIKSVFGQINKNRSLAYNAGVVTGLAVHSIVKTVFATSAEIVRGQVDVIKTIYGKDGAKTLEGAEVEAPLGPVQQPLPLAEDKSGRSPTREVVQPSGELIEAAI